LIYFAAGASAIVDQAGIENGGGAHPLGACI
jgi:hypothetical protein